MATGTLSKNLAALRRIPGEAVLVAHAMLTACALLLGPRGFPLTHPRFWIGSLLPFVVLVLSTVAVVQLLRERPRFPAVFLMGLAGAWLGASVACRLFFPVSLAELWLGGISVGLVLVVASLVLGARALDSRILGKGKSPFVFQDAATLVGGIVVGVLFAVGLHPPDPTTVPLARTTQQSLLADSQPSTLPVLGDKILVSTGLVRMTYQPLLTFDRISPDRFWSLLAPSVVTRKPLDKGEGVYRFSDGATLSVTDLPEETGISITALTPVDRDTYSHLNNFCELLMEGCQHPSISFSPCGGQQFDVLPADYPTGQPARFACLNADHEFVVLEASSGEKGPFRKLAGGPLAKGDPLVIQFYDKGDWVASLTLEDWSAQASTALSPSAGWKMPVNAIEFQRDGDTGPINLWVSLAVTSVGRGWDTVGHTAGCYRNRCQIRWKVSE